MSTSYKMEKFNNKLLGGCVNSDKKNILKLGPGPETVFS